MSAERWFQLLPKLPRPPVCFCSWPGSLLLMKTNAPSILEGMTYVSSHGAFNELVLDAEQANIKPAGRHGPSRGRARHPGFGLLPVLGVAEGSI